MITSAELVYKAPWEEADYHYKMEPRLPTGVTVASIVTVTTTRTDGAASDLVVGSSAISSDGKTIQVRLSAGTNGKDYVVSFRMIWSDGQKREAEGFLLVRESG